MHSKAESTRFGNFVADVLKMLNGWWTNESKYLEECSNKAAFSLQSGEQSSTSSSGGMAYSEFAFWNQQVHSIITKVGGKRCVSQHCLRDTHRICYRI